MRRALAVIALAGCSVAPMESLDFPYDRRDWPHWRDLDGDCQDARQEVLVAASQTEVTFTDERECRVATGTWVCPYTGLTITNPSDIDIDHVVALRDAHDSGGHAWTRDQRTAFANDQSNLLPVSASANRSKGSKGAARWLPVLPEYRCVQLANYVNTKTRYGLTTTPEDDAVIGYMFRACERGEAPHLPQ